MICHALTFGISRCGRKGTEGVGANYRVRLTELNSIAWDKFHVAQMSLSYEFYSFPRLGGFTDRHHKAVADDSLFDLKTLNH
jgi:hypothetical protein